MAESVRSHDLRTGDLRLAPRLSLARMVTQYVSTAGSYQARSFGVRHIHVVSHGAASACPIILELCPDMLPCLGRQFQSSGDTHRIRRDR